MEIELGYRSKVAGIGCQIR